MDLLDCITVPHSSVGKESTCNAGDPGLIPGLEDPLEKRKATHSSILAWRIPIVHGVTKSRTQLSNCHSLYIIHDNCKLNF